MRANTMTTNTQLFSGNFSIWLAAVSFVLFQFSLQLSSGVVLGAIMHEMHLSALTMGFIGSSFYFVYTALQLPAGILFDRKNARYILAFSALVCSVGCAIFAKSNSVFALLIGRVTIGAGSAFAFVGLTHLLRQHFKPSQFAFMIGMSETIGFLATVFGMIGMGELIAKWGWRAINDYAAVIGLIIAFACWRKVPNTKPILPRVNSYHKYLIKTVTNWRLWLNGLIAGLAFSTITVFGALWSVPFIQTKLHCSLEHASMVGAILFLGTAVSCIIFGVLPSYVSSRPKLIKYSSYITAMMFLILLYMPSDNQLLVSLMMFLIGVCCGGYLLTYSISNDLSSKRSRSCAAGFTNTLAVLVAPILQPINGYILDLTSKNGQYTLYSYQLALSIIPAVLIMAGLLCYFLPNKQSTVA